MAKQRGLVPLVSLARNPNGQLAVEHPNKRAGFSLIELLVVLAVFGIIASVFSSTFLDSWYSQLVQQAYGELQRKSRFTVDEITHQARSASSVITSTTFSGTTYTSTSSSLVIRLAPIDANDNQLTGDDYLVFRRNPTTSTKTERLVIPNGSSQRASWPFALRLNDETSALQIRYYNSVGTELTPGSSDLTQTKRLTVLSRSSRSLRGRTYTREIETTVSLRNKSQ